MTRVRESTARRVGCCGNGARRRSCDRWIRPRSRILPDREWFTLAITVTPAGAPKPKTEPAKENAGSKSEPGKPAESRQSKPDETAKPAASGKSAAPAEKAKVEPPALPLPTKTFYYTLIVFPAGAYDIGSVNDEPDRQKNEVRHRVTLTRPYALLDREITVLELIAFSPLYAQFMRQFDAKPADAGFGADWYDAVGFCRWLGQQSGLSEGDQSYPAPETLDKAKYPREPNPAANWAPRNWPVELGRRGFRLPTESEWEVASRAGARTTYGFGSDVSLLGRFGWFAENSGKHGHPPRELRPSIRGLFDVHGNRFEWTHDWYGEFEETAAVDSLGAKEGSYRRAPWRRLEQRRGVLPVGVPQHERPDVPHEQQRLPPGPESVWSLAGGGISQGSGAIGRRHGGSVSGAATGDAVAGWRSGVGAIDIRWGCRGCPPAWATTIPFCSVTASITRRFRSYDHGI